MNSNELFALFGEKVPGYEYLFFTWSGGGDDFGGFVFKEALKIDDCSPTEEKPAELTDDLIKELNCSSVFEDMSMRINCTDSGWSNGVLMMALEPLTDAFEFYDDGGFNMNLDSGFKGIAVQGCNREEIGSSVDL